MHTEPRHPDRFAVFFPAGMLPARALDLIQAEHPRTAGKPHSLHSGPAWVFSRVDLDPAEQKQAAIAAATSRRPAHPSPLHRALDAAILATEENQAERLADLLAALHQ